jgi:magnesium-transporting ATPase (P-type)
MNYYDIGMKSQLFNLKIFWTWILSATFQSIIVIYISFAACERNFASPDGKVLQVWSSGIMVFGLVVLISNFKVLIISNDYSLGSMVIILLSLVLYQILYAVFIV